MAQISLNNVSFAYSHPALLDGVTLHIEPGERVGLVGRNGAGKSTLLKLLMGKIQPDNGSVDIGSDVRIAWLVQDVPAAGQQSAFQIAAEGFGPLAQAVHDYRRLNRQLQNGDPLSSAEQIQFEQASSALADAEQWDAADRLDGLLKEMDLPPDAAFETLSAGMKRRVLLARAMIQQPDVLLLDEPTNHLDIESILWLQDYLNRFSGTLIFITHDRVFLQDIARRIIEIDRGRLFDWTCDYQTFLKRRDEMLAAEAAAEAHFDRKLAEEERWIRQGIKARRTRNEGRVRALKKMRQERAARRSKVGTASLQVQEAEKSGRLVAHAEDITHGYDDRTLIRDFNLTISRGDRIGLVGPNGAGKSTLLKILLGDIQPDQGSVRIGTNLQVAYFDQLRDQLDLQKTARENIGEGSDQLLINGQKRHVMGYLQDFLFAPDRAHTRVEFLSGGERNRLLLAKLFTKPANILVLDEPTNDLDTETLELLEETLPEFNGTVLVVSHDRAFLNNVVTSIVAFEGDGVVREYDGGYDDWLRQRPDTEDQPEKSGAASPGPRPATPQPEATDQSSKKSRKLTYREQRELDLLPERIDELESRQAEIHATMAEPEFFQQDGAQIAAVHEELERISSELAECYARWEELD